MTGLTKAKAVTTADQRLTKYVQTDGLFDWPPPHAIVSVADVFPGVGPGEVAHAECLARHGLVGAQAPGEGLVMLERRWR